MLPCGNCRSSPARHAGSPQTRPQQPGQDALSKPPGSRQRSSCCETISSERAGGRRLGPHRGLAVEGQRALRWLSHSSGTWRVNSPRVAQPPMVSRRLPRSTCSRRSSRMALARAAATCPSPASRARPATSTPGRHPARRAGPGRLPKDRPSLLGYNQLAAESAAQALVRCDAGPAARRGQPRRRPQLRLASDWAHCCAPPS